jgi:exonuclease VII small subunit
MNKRTRKQLSDLHTKLEEIKSQVEAIRDEEQDKFDNMPEGLQSGERGEKTEEVIGALEDATTSLEEALDRITAATE